MKEQTFSQVARIGQLVQLLTIAPKTAEAANQTIDQLIRALDAIDLPHTLGAAQQLQTFQRETLRKYSTTQGLSNAHDIELATTAKTIIKALHHEASEKHTLILDASAVAKSLRKLPERLPFLTEAQSHLRYEVIRCLECSAYRSAIVMAWNFAFDYIRHWVFSNHLSPFNSTLTTKYTIQKSGQPLPRYDAITHYPDFWEARSAPGERTVLDTCQDANILPGKAYDSLIECLRRRNDYAHPNFKTPDVDLTKGYIAELISVILSDPFPKPSGT